MSKVFITSNYNTKNNIPFICSGQGLENLFSKMKDPVGLEIGTDVGDTSEFLLKSNPNLKLFTIDPYVDYTDWNGNFLRSSLVYEKYMTRLSNYKDRHEHLRCSSDEAVDELKDKKFDFIFIDGIHTYEQVSIDCNNFYSMLKDGGIFSGHDYNVIKVVRQAVDEFATRVNKKVLTTYHDVWYWIK